MIYIPTELILSVRALLRLPSTLPYTFDSFKGMSTLRLLLGHKASSSGTVHQEIEVGASSTLLLLSLVLKIVSKLYLFVLLST